MGFIERLIDQVLYVLAARRAASHIAYIANMDQLSALMRGNDEWAELIDKRTERYLLAGQTTTPSPAPRLYLVIIEDNEPKIYGPYIDKLDRRLAFGDLTQDEDTVGYPLDITCSRADAELMVEIEAPMAGLAEELREQTRRRKQDGRTT